MCANPEVVEPDLKSVCSVQDEGPQTNARAAGNANVTEPIGSGEDAIVKKRKTRRGKSKRRNPNPYSKLSWQQRKNLNNSRQQQTTFSRKYRANLLNHGQALAPFNSNQFLMEDHGELQELDDKLNKSDGVSAAGTSMVPPRTRDSSFSVDSDGDFYSSPEDEEEFLTKEFDNAYEDLHAERLQSMSKAELIEEYLQLETKVDLLTKRLRGKSTNIASAATTTTNNEDESGTGGGVQTNTPRESLFQQEINKLLLENDELRRENEHLRNNMCRTSSSFSSSMDSESDSSSSTCNSSTTNTSNTGDAVDMKVDEAAEDAADVDAPAPLTNGFDSPESQDQLQHQQPSIDV